MYLKQLSILLLGAIYSALNLMILLVENLKVSRCKFILTPDKIHLMFRK